MVQRNTFYRSGCVHEKDKKEKGECRRETEYLQGRGEMQRERWSKRMRTSRVVCSLARIQKETGQGYFVRGSTENGNKSGRVFLFPCFDKLFMHFSNSKHFF